jgi:hypothetical protein
MVEPQAWPRLQAPKVTVGPHCRTRIIGSINAASFWQVLETQSLVYRHLGSPSVLAEYTIQQAANNRDSLTSNRIILTSTGKSLQAFARLALKGPHCQ